MEQHASRGILVIPFTRAVYIIIIMMSHTFYNTQ